MTNNPKNRRRSQTVGCRLDPKLDYLLTLAARDQGCSVSAYLEQAIRKALGEHEREAEVGTEFVPPPALKPMWEERLWAEDESERLFRLTTERPDLLTPAEARLCKLLVGSILLQNHKLTPLKFHAAYNDTAVDKTHLDSEVE